MARDDSSILHRARPFSTKSYRRDVQHGPFIAVSTLAMAEQSAKPSPRFLSAVFYL
jgi:hypothetical protein